MEKRLCRACAFPVRPTDRRCGRCGASWPYFSARGGDRSKPTRRGMTVGKDCPLCGRRTRREPSPMLLKPLRWILRRRFTYRRCEECGWQGGAFHAPADERSRARRTSGASPGAPGGPRRRDKENPGADGSTP